MTNQIYLAVWSSSRVEYRETCFSSHQLIGWAFLRRFPCMWGLAGWCPRDRSSSGWCLTIRSSKGLTDRTCLLWHGIWYMALPIFPNCFSLLQIHWNISSDQASVMNLEGRNDNFLHNNTDRQTDRQTGHWKGLTWSRSWCCGLHWCILSSPCTLGHDWALR